MPDPIPGDRADHYRQMALATRELASRIHDPNIKSGYFEPAGRWLKLARPRRPGVPLLRWSRGGPPVTGYRLYIKDYAGHIREARTFECPDDQEAHAIAEAERDPRSKELWSQGRLVRAYEAAEHVAAV